MKPFKCLGATFIILLVAVAAGCVAAQNRPSLSSSPQSPTALPLRVTIVPPAGVSITGTVLNPEGAPLSGATVRVKATENMTVSVADGSFTLYGLSAGQPVLLTAWASGYFNSGGDTQYYAGESDVIIVLNPLAVRDNPAYKWVSAFTSEGQSNNCELCHSALAPDASSEVGGQVLPFDEWQKDAHGLSAQNRRFLSMYLGRDLQGNQSPLTRYGYSNDYGRFPLRPDLTQPYYGPGYKLDFPKTTGNCAACHLPAAAVDNAYEIDPTTVSWAEAEGILCDFCHKIQDVKLNPETGLPYPNMPGVLSLEFLRPSDGHQFFAGPFDDVAPGEDTYSTLQQQSQFCASCHFGTFWDTTIYNSFGEWLESPYSDPVSGKTCQDCHMPHSGASYLARPDKGAVERDPETIFSHLMPGASSTELLQNAVTMHVSTIRTADRVTVVVTLVNDKTGHDVPTDSPLRQMILLVQTRGPDGSALTQIEGPTVPGYGGVGDPGQGYYAGLPGKIYAKILRELWTGLTPTGAYWNPTRIVSDNRLAALETDISTYVFATSPDGYADVTVTLLYRRAFKLLMDQKGWNVPDLLMARQIVPVEK